MNNFEYCVTCEWSGIKPPSGVYHVRNKDDVESIIAYLKMPRSASSCIPSNIRIYKKDKSYFI